MMRGGLSPQWALKWIICVTKGPSTISSTRCLSGNGDCGGDDGRNRLDSPAPPTTSAAYQEEPPRNDPSHGGHPHDLGSGGSRQLLPQTAVPLAVEAHERQRSAAGTSWHQEEPVGLDGMRDRDSPIHDSGGAGSYHQLLPPAAALAAEPRERQLSAAGSSVQQQDGSSVLQQTTVMESIFKELQKQSTERERQGEVLAQLIKEQKRQGEVQVEQGEVLAQLLKEQKRQGEVQVEQGNVQVEQGKVVAQLLKEQKRQGEVQVEQGNVQVEQGKVVAQLLKEQKRMQIELTGVSDSVSGAVESIAARNLQEQVGVKVQQNAQVNGAESALSPFMRGVSAAGKESALSAVVQRLMDLSGLRAAVQHLTAGACADLEDLLQERAAGAAASDPAAAAAAAHNAAIAQAHLAALRALQDQLAAAAGPGMDAGCAAAAHAALGAARRYIDGTRRGRHGSSVGGGSSQGGGAEPTDSEDCSDSDADAQTCMTRFDAAMMLLDAARQVEADKLLRRMLRDGPASMLLLSALQPAGTGSMPPVTQLELDGLAVRRGGGSGDALMLVVLEAKSSKSGLPAARKQLKRAGTVLAYVYNVAVAAGVFGPGEPPPLNLEGRIALARVKGLSLPQEREVELVPAEGKRHMMRECVTGLSENGLNA